MACIRTAELSVGVVVLCVSIASCHGSGSSAGAGNLAGGQLSPISSSSSSPSSSSSSPSSSPSPSPSPSSPSPSSPSPSSPTYPAGGNVRVHHHNSPPAAAAPPGSAAPATQSGAWCTANAVYNAQYNDYDIYVHSNQPGQTATATAADTDNDGESRQSYQTDSSGYADIYLYTGAGDTVSVQVGAATCSVTA